MTTKSVVFLKQLSEVKVKPATLEKAGKNALYQFLRDLVIRALARPIL